ANRARQRSTVPLDRPTPSTSWRSGDRPNRGPIRFSAATSFSYRNGCYPRPMNAYIRDSPTSLSRRDEHLALAGLDLSARGVIGIGHAVLADHRQVTCDRIALDFDLGTSRLEFGGALDPVRHHAAARRPGLVAAGHADLGVHGGRLLVENQHLPRCRASLDLG